MSEPITDLPFLGLGAGIWPAHIPFLFDGMNDLESIDYLELYADDIDELHGDLPGWPSHLRTVLHGTQLSPGGANSIPLALIEKTRRASDQLRSPWVVEDLGVWRLDGRRPLTAPFWPPVMDCDMLELVARRLGALSFGLGRPFLSEVPPLDVFVGEYLLPEFFRRLVDKTNCPLVLDVSHWLKYAQIVGADPLQAWSDFPFENVAELHISGGHYAEGEKWYDEEHSAPLLKECVSLLIEAAQRAPHLRAVTLELHGALPEIIRRELERLAAIPEIRAVRERAREDRSARGLNYIPSLESVEDWQTVVSAQGPERLLHRQRMMRDILEDPAGLDQFLSGAWEMGQSEQALFAGTSGPNWREASNYRISQIAAGLPKITKKLVETSGLDLSSEYRDFLKSRGQDFWLLPTQLQLVSFLASRPTLPRWLSECMAFERDVLLLAEGQPPQSDSVAPTAEGKFIISYEIPVVDAINAILRQEALPDFIQTSYAMSVDGGTLTVRRVPSANIAQP